MDEAFLNDLLECSVCLEQLDSTSKVLPCQHTFCKRCLEDIVSCHKELRCPECRILVETKVEDLPCNILLIRLLEGIKSTAALNKNVSSANSTHTKTEAMIFQGPKTSLPTNQLQHSASSDLRAHIKQVIQPLPCAKALYPYEAKRLGDLSFKKGDMIVLRKRIDQNWYEGETNGKLGYLPATHIQIIVPLHFPIPQGKALYDFHANNKDDKDCLTFLKGETVTFMRKVDSNWAEGKIGERSGIFPISFVELNASAKALMKLSSNQQMTRPSLSTTTCEIQPACNQTEPTVVSSVHPVSLPASSNMQYCAPPPTSSPSVSVTTTASTCPSSPIFTTVAMKLHDPLCSSIWQTSLPLSSGVPCPSDSNQRDHSTYGKHNLMITANSRESPPNIQVSQSIIYQRDQNLCTLNAIGLSNNLQSFPQISYCNNYKREHALHAVPQSSVNYLDTNSHSLITQTSHINNYDREQTMNVMQIATVTLSDKEVSHPETYNHSISRLTPPTVSYDAIPAPDAFSLMSLHTNNYSEDQVKLLPSHEENVSPESENVSIEQPAEGTLETEEEQHTSSLSDSGHAVSREDSPIFSPVSNISGSLEKEQGRSSPLITNFVPITNNESTQNIGIVSSGIHRESTPASQEDTAISQTYLKDNMSVTASNQRYFQTIEHGLHAFPASNVVTSSMSQGAYCPDISSAGPSNPTVMVQPSSDASSTQWKERCETISVNTSLQDGEELDNKVVLPCNPTPANPSSPSANGSKVLENEEILASQLYYLALYNYHPQKKDELELKRGELYIVNEKCQDGWFKGTSMKTRQNGVFPGNYVQPTKFSVLQSPLHGATSFTSTRPMCSNLSGSQTNIEAAVNPKLTCNTSLKTLGSGTYGQVISDRSLSLNSSAINIANRLPEKSQSSSITAPSQLPWTLRSSVMVSSESISQIQKVEQAASKQNVEGHLRSSHWSSQNLSNSASNSPILPECSLKMTSNSGSTDCISSMGQLYGTSPLSSLESSQVWPSCSQGRRLSRHSPLHTQSVLPPTSTGNNNVAGGLSTLVSNIPVSSCSQGRTDKPKERKEKERVSLMKRLTKKKSKSPPPNSYSMNGSTLAESPGSSSQSCLPLVHVRSVSCPSEALGSQTALHKKSCSLDGNAAGVQRLSSRSKQPAPLIKERFRCIVPYPPNSDYELELKVGDIVYVHKKRDDGWYKGTLQRTGRTGLFPASFVESF
ncbi:E3 ubiquitin-protein ligase SH3RF1-like isoform X2 [Centruroides vittatus]|uniref:E3 ubiquitin-protein ligase SH3RF1-like isoform X2 n=1 Tax=Centruroides vittatus TaxID=120091 RepID=UPI00350F1C73